MFEHSYHATHTTCGDQYPQEDESFELGDIDDGKINNIWYFLERKACSSV